MSLLGKILLFVNLLAAGGLAYLTAQDWAKRQEINALLLRHQMTLAGIPVEEPKGAAGDDDEVAVVVEATPGQLAPATISRKLYDAHFQGAGGPPPRSQVKEVDEIHKKIRQQAAGMPGDADKLRYLCGGLNPANQFEPGLLMRFADSFEERQAVRNLALTRNPQQISQNVSEAYRRLDRKFEAALQPPNPAAAQADAQKLADLQGRIAGGDQKAAAELADIFAEGNPPYSRDEADRRNRIAQLLMLQDISATNQRRVMLLVGLRVYARAVNELVARMEEVVRRVERQIEQDQSKFQEEYELLKRLAVEQDQLLYQQLRVVEGMRNQAADDDRHVQVRQTQLDALQKDLKDVADAVAKLLDNQAVVERQLFEVQKRVGATLRGNFDLEEKLLKAEEAEKK